jgi:hypothetical protein
MTGRIQYEAAPNHAHISKNSDLESSAYNKNDLQEVITYLLSHPYATRYDVQLECHFGEKSIERLYPQAIRDIRSTWIASRIDCSVDGGTLAGVKA